MTITSTCCVSAIPVSFPLFAGTVRDVADELWITGKVAPGYEPVREAFAQHPSGGSALCVLRHGEVVVNLCEGWRDAGRTRPWDASTLVNVYSVGKPIIAVAILVLVG